MNVLNSSEAFCEHYAEYGVNLLTLGVAVASGGAVAGGTAGTAAMMAATAAAEASAWSTFASWPVIGTYCAGKATAVGVAAGTAALGSAAVLVPAALLGVGVAGAICYCGRKKKSRQKGTGVEHLARVFSRIAFLPMMAAAVAVCQDHPESEDSVRNYVLKQTGAWGYSEEYVRNGFSEAMRYTPSQLTGEYNFRMEQLKAGSTKDLGATPAELPANVVKGIAEEFEKEFNACVG